MNSSIGKGVGAVDPAERPMRIGRGVFYLYWIELSYPAKGPVL